MRIYVHMQKEKAKLNMEQRVEKSPLTTSAPTKPGQRGGYAPAVTNSTAPLSPQSFLRYRLPKPIHFDFGIFLFLLKLVGCQKAQRIAARQN